jgi:hypothetical protein
VIRVFLKNDKSLFEEDIVRIKVFGKKDQENVVLYLWKTSKLC